MAFHRDSSAVSCGLLVVTLGAWNLVFWLLCWPELYANFFFEAGLCAPQGVPAIVPYRHCDSRCVGCGRCGYGQRRCVDVLAEHRRSDPHDLARSASLAGPCCGGYHCCRQSCRTRCRRRSILALDDEVVDEIVDEWVVIDGTDAIVDGTNASAAARDERRKLRGAHSRGRGRSSCHTVCSCAHAVLNRMCAVGCTEYVEVATAIRVDGATLGAAGAHVNLVRDFRGDRAAAQRELRTARAARAVGGVLLRPRARAAHRRARGERRRAALRRRDGVHVVAVAPPRRRLGAVCRRLLRRRRRRRRRAPRSDGPQHRARDRRRRVAATLCGGAAGGAGCDRVARCAAGAGRALPPAGLPRP